MTAERGSKKLPTMCEHGELPIEITQEMIAAGAEVLRERCDVAPYWSKHVAREVFEVMARSMKLSFSLAPKLTSGGYETSE